MEDKTKQIELEIIESQKQVGDIIQKTIERGDKLEDLEQQSKALKDTGKLFNKQAKKLKWRNWCKKSKFHLFIGISVIVVVGIIVLVIVL